jgi:drug/metabolite transporter (DMT)-like permease
MRLSGKAAGIASGAAIALFWGLSFLSIKVSVAVIPPMTLGLLRFAAATALLYAAMALMGPVERIGAKDSLGLAAAGLIGVSLYFFMENNGVKLTSASESSILISTIPVLSLIAERLFLKARLSALQYAGALLSAVGVWMTAAPGLRGSSGGLGYAYMAGAALSWVAYSFISRPLFDRYGRLTVVFWQCLYGTLGFIPFALAERGAWVPVSSAVWLNVAFLAVACSALGYWLYAVSVQNLGLTASSVFINLIPVISATASRFILGERLAPLQIGGAAVVVAGVFMASTGGGQKGKPPKAPKG